MSFGDKNIAMRGLALSLASIGALVSGCALNEQSADAQQIDIGMEGYARALSIEVSSDKVKSLGSASWLSSDLVITASHLFLNMPEDSQVRVGKRGAWVEAEVVAIDDPAILDLAILRVRNGRDIQPTVVGLASVRICEKQIKPAQEVLVVSEFHNGSSRSYGSPDYMSYSQGAMWTSHLTGYYPEGTSGGALYEVKSGCLAGVISRRRESFATGSPSIYSTEFVTAKEINQFLRDNGVRLPENAL
nr:trypsin-like peptidase domain-containing protein [Pseudomonas aeruginosa]